MVVPISHLCTWVMYILLSGMHRQRVFTVWDDPEVWMCLEMSCSNSQKIKSALAIKETKVENNTYM